MKKDYTKETQEILNKFLLTEKEINLIKNRLNKCLIKGKLNYKEKYAITKEQEEKGLKWLLSKWKKRGDNPFGYREQEALETFECFKFVGFYDAGNRYNRYCLPIYRVVGKTGTFEYYVKNGKIEIIG